MSPTAEIPLYQNPDNSTLYSEKPFVADQPSSATLLCEKPTPVTSPTTFACEVAGDNNYQLEQTVDGRWRIIHSAANQPDVCVWAHPRATASEAITQAQEDGFEFAELPALELNPDLICAFCRTSTVGGCACAQ